MSRRCVRVVFAALVASAAASGGWVIGQTPQITWQRARDHISKYRTILDSSGLVEIGAHMPPTVRRDSLRALCEGRNESLKLSRESTLRRLRSLIPGDDPMTVEQQAVHERYLGATASFAGDFNLAAQHFDNGRKVVESLLLDAPDLKRVYLGLVLSLAATHMRQGETSNCLVAGSADRCLFPLRPGGIHMHPENAQAAIAQLSRYLELEPEDLGVRWLLNLAYMLAGRYPQEVPPTYLLKPELFRSEASMPRFIDVARTTGLGQKGIAGGTIADDFDGDGLIDVFFTAVEYCTSARLYRNRGDGNFEDRTEAAGLQEQLGGINATQTDYNNDGRIDVFIMRGGWESAMRNSLLRNNPDGTFTDVTREAGLLDATHATHSVAWADFDNDGWLDVFIAHELTPSQLFRNRKDGTFEDVTKQAGVGQTMFTKGVVAGDYDGNGFADLYLSNMFGDNILYRNNGDGTFIDVSVRAGVQKPFASFPTWFFDYDNDGRLDIFVSSYPNSLEEFVKYYVKQPLNTEPAMLYRNNGDGTFAEMSETMNLNRVIPTMGSNFGDLDNDGYLDMYLGTGAPSFATLLPNIMLKNDRGRRFLDVTEATGTGNLQKGHGIAFVDLDNDGDEDVVLNSGGAVRGDNYDESLYENPGAPGNWISLRLVGVKSNRSAIGAKITVRLPDSSTGSSLRYREVTSGGSFGSNSLTQHIGLGGARGIESVDIEWPVSRTRQVFRNVPINAALEITEFEQAFVVRKLPRFALRSN